MPVDIKDLVKGEKTLDLSYNGHNFQVTYRMGWWTPEATARHTKLAEETSSDNAFLVRFLDTVVDWDVTDGKVKLAITRDGLEKLTWNFLVHIWNAIAADRFVGEEVSG